MKALKIYIFSAILIILFLIPTSIVLANNAPFPDAKGITWSGWNNYPNTNIFYRIQLLDPMSSKNETVAVEILNNYKKDVSFSIALNDDGLRAPYEAVHKLHKNQTTIVNYPRPKDSFQFFASFNNIEVN